MAVINIGGRQVVQALVVSVVVVVVDECVELPFKVPLHLKLARQL